MECNSFIPEDGQGDEGQRNTEEFFRLQEADDTGHMRVTSIPEWNQFWRLEVPGQGAVGLMSGGGSLLGL